LCYTIVTITPLIIHPIALITTHIKPNYHNVGSKNSAMKEKVDLTCFLKNKKTHNFQIFILSYAPDD